MKIEHMKAIIAGAEASLRTVADDENFQTISSKIDVDLQTIIQGLYDLYEAMATPRLTPTMVKPIPKLRKRLRIFSIY